MEIAVAIAILNGANTLVGIALKIRDWFRSAANAPNVDPAVSAALSKLPKNASADDIVNVLRPFYVAKGGDVDIKGGNDGGGHVNLTHTSIVAGSGPGGGGNASLTGGDGGIHGNGGNVSMVEGEIKGGNAK